MRGTLIEKREIASVPAMAISRSGVGQNNFIDKFENYVIKLFFNDIFISYMLPE